MKRISFAIGAGAGAVLLPLLLSIPRLSPAAATSDVADAVMHGDSVAVRALLDKHADVNVPQPDGATALHWAVFRSDKETVELLLKAGANPKAANREGSTPLWLASVNGNAVIVADLLNAGADANEALPFGRTALMEASRTGSVDTIKVLLDHGANIEAREKLRGTTPLMWAAEQGHAPAIKFLIDHGADIKERSDPAERGRGPALGKSNDPRKAVAAQGAALAAGKSVELSDLSALRGDSNGIAGGTGRAGGSSRF